MRKLFMPAITALVFLSTLSAVAGEPQPLGHGENGIAGPEDLVLEKVEMKPGSFAYLESTVMGDWEAAFGKVVTLGYEQGLIGEQTMFGSVYPNDMSLGVDEDTPVYIGFSIPEDTEVAEPLKQGELAGGSYLKVEHRGDYELLGETYTKIFCWAAENEIELGIPSFEHYVTDPGVAPVEEWLTYIYLPFQHPAKESNPLKPVASTH